MPNWTFNTITIKGESEALAKMLNDAVKDEDGNIKLSSWFPIPETFLKYDTTNHPNGARFAVGEEYWDGLGHKGIMTEELLNEYKQATKEQKERYGVVGWYDYNCKYLGCKWDCDVDIRTEEKDCIVLHTDTPWTAPTAFLYRMSKRYPTLTFRNDADYEDGNWEVVLYKDGNVEITDYGESEGDE